MQSTHREGPAPAAFPDFCFGPKTVLFIAQQDDASTKIFAKRRGPGILGRNILTLGRIYGILIMSRGRDEKPQQRHVADSPIRHEAKWLKTRLVILRASVFVRAMEKPEGRR